MTMMKSKQHKLCFPVLQKPADPAGFFVGRTEIAQNFIGFCNGSLTLPGIFQHCQRFIADCGNRIGIHAF
ncbi:hypothetical protein GJU94_09185 [Brucella sp. 10RB9214]|uniref:hypothetical protein n=1 Tax=unclassified Brucella TaxID=2632610 RepID=UPI0009728A11|nr:MULTISPECIES: hypothetical protein [unclassified Brucella]APY14125.1 hypothetical protein BKD02_07425 [Brucella sp. 09RB8910]MRN46841.1 hypothetical protein [Brucella sp. 10RB9212]MRN50006.1 hypothetical protein [Brucella sp. 10RB9214]QPN28695.1 hypothetical protein I5770_08855 [Brucella sp. BO2]